MRWVAFILLLLGMYFSLSAFWPAAPGEASIGRPFPALHAADNGQADARALTVKVLAGTAAVLFAAAVIGLFVSAMPETVWMAAVSLAVVSSGVLYLRHFGSTMVAPLGIDAALAAGLITGSWLPGLARMRTLQSREQRIHPLMRVPVPWVFALAFLIGVGMQWLVPIVAAPKLAFECRVAGGVLLAAGVALAVWSLGLFRKARTTTIPYETASTLVTYGPYRWSRNPMYVSLTLVYLGCAGVNLQFWPLAVLPFVTLYIRGVVVPAEEERLQAAFGDAYTQYCARVRRWV